MEKKSEWMKVLLVGANVNHDPDFESSLAELALLAAA